MTAKGNTNINASVSTEVACKLRLAAAERGNAEGRFVGMSRLVEEALRRYLGMDAQ